MNGAAVYTDAQFQLFHLRERLMEIDHLTPRGAIYLLRDGMLALIEAVVVDPDPRRTIRNRPETREEPR